MTRSAAAVMAAACLVWALALTRLASREPPSPALPGTGHRGSLTEYPGP